MDSNTREELDALIGSEGWRLFTAYVTSEWGPGGRAFVAAVTQAADNRDDKNATDHLRQIITAQKYINAMLRWPEEQLQRLKQPDLVAATTDYSRRGRL